MRKELPEGKWGYSRIYEDINVAIATGHSHDFWELPENTQAYLIARFRAKGTIDAYEDEMSKKKAESNRKLNRPGSMGRRGR